MSRKPKPSGGRRRFQGDYKDLLSWLEKHGYELQMTGGQHYKVKCPSGSVVLPLTPSDYRGTMNAVSQLRRHGVPI